jgi:hypothetical protein
MTKNKKEFVILKGRASNVGHVELLSTVCVT